MTKQELISLLQEEFYLSVDVNTEQYCGWGDEVQYRTRVTVKLIDNDTGCAILTGES